MKKISFVIPCYASSVEIYNVVDEIKKTMSQYSEYQYEIILINDSSPDNTLEVIRELCINNKEIIGIDLAKNFGQHSALMAGFAYISGDIIVCLDDDGQTPADEVYKLIKKVEEGADVVYARYEDKMHSVFRNFGSRVNNIMMQFMLQKPKNLYISSYFAAKRFIIDNVKEYRNSYPYVMGLVLRTTNKIENVDVTHRKRRSGQSGYTFSKLVGLWLNGLLAFSVKPLRIATLIGSVFSVLGLLFAIYTIVIKILNPEILIGWSSLMSALLFIGGTVLMLMGLIGEYVGRIYIGINSAPQYVIREEIKRTSNNTNQITNS